MNRLNKQNHTNQYMLPPSAIKFYSSNYCDFYLDDAGEVWSVNNFQKTVIKLKPHKYGYVRPGMCINGEFKQFYAHRKIWEFYNGPIPDGLVIDHINGIRHDNRLSNLQLVTTSQNNQKSVFSKINHSSKYQGVRYCKSRKKFQARINFNGKTRSLGYFDNEELAYQAYVAAKIKYHGVESIALLPVVV